MRNLIRKKIIFPSEENKLQDCLDSKQQPMGQFKSLNEI